MEPAIRVAVVEDHEMFSEALVSALEIEPDIDVVGCAATVEAARQMVSDIEIDILLMDYRVGTSLGTAATRELRLARPSMRVILVTASTDEAVLDEALRAGCVGYVSKAEPLQDLLAALRAVHAGATAISPRMLDRLMVRRVGNRSRLDSLTARERTVLLHLAEGSSSAEIAEALHISSNTLRNHTQNILGKLDAHSKLEAVSIALRERLITVPEPAD